MISRRSFGLLCSALVASAAFPALSHAAEADDLGKAKELVETIATRGIEEVVATDLPQSEKINRFRAIFSSYFDLPAAARFVLGRYWRSATPEQQEEFVSLFQDVNIYTWARRFKDYKGQKLSVGSVSPDGDNGAYVESSVNQGDDQAPLVVRWRLRKRPDSEYRYLVVDLEVEGVSMAVTYRSEYNAALQSSEGDMAPLLKQLQQQVDRLKAEQPA